MTPAGGIERVIATLANEFSEFMDVTVLVKDKAYSHYRLDSKVRIESLDNEIRLDLNNKFNRVKEATKNFMSSRRKLKKFLSDNEFDYFYIAHPLNALELHLAKGINNQVILTEHGGIDAYNQVYKKLKAWLYPKAKVYVVPTKTDAKLYKELGFHSVYIPHFKSKISYVKSLQNKKIAITIGRITEAKRQWILIDLWDKIIHDHKIFDWQLYIIGDGNLRKEYLEKIEKLRLEKYVKILPPRQDVENYYKEASFFLLTSKSEGFGMVILEAMSFGIPCVSYDCPAGPRDMIRNNVDGFLVEMDNFQELEKSTLKMIRDNEKMLDFGNQAFLASKKWDGNIVLEEWKKLLT